MNTRTTPWVFLLVLLAATAAWSAQPSMGPEQVVSAQDFDEFNPQTAYNSNHDEFLVVWHDVSPVQSRSVMGKRVDHSGATIEEFVIAFEDTPPRDNAQPTVAYDPGNDVYLVAWVRDEFGNDSDWDVYGRIIPWDGPDASHAAFAICTFTSNQWNPRAAFADTHGEFLVTWWNEGSGGSHSYISAQRVDPSGGLISGTILVTSGGEERVVPDIAYNPARNEYLIVYQLMDEGLGNIYGVRMSGQGTILGGGDFGIAAWPDPETLPRVAASRLTNQWAVVWQSDVPGFLKEIYARRVWVDGAGSIQTGTPVYVAGTVVDERNPDIAAHPESADFLIAWEQQYTDSSGPFGIWSRTLSATNLMGPPISPRTPSGTLNSTKPEIAASSNNWLVVWEQDRYDTPSYQDIHGRVILGPLFSDGFEDATTDRWSMVEP